MCFRIIGICLLILGCGMYGLMMKNNYIGRIRELEKFLMLLEHLKNEIQYKNCNLLENLNSIHSESFRKFIKEITNGIENGQAVSKLWEKSSKKNLLKTSLKKCDIDMISEIGKELGLSDRETQINHISFFQNKINQVVLELKKEKKEKCKLYSSLGFISGMFLGILFI